MLLMSPTHLYTELNCSVCIHNIPSSVSGLKGVESADTSVNLILCTAGRTLLISGIIDAGFPVWEATFRMSLSTR